MLPNHVSQSGNGSVIEKNMKPCKDYTMKAEATKLEAVHGANKWWNRIDDKKNPLIKWSTFEHNGIGVRVCKLYNGGCPPNLTFAHASSVLCRACFQPCSCSPQNSSNVRWERYRSWSGRRRSSYVLRHGYWKRPCSESCKLFASKACTPRPESW